MTFDSHNVVPGLIGLTPSCSRQKLCMNITLKGLKRPLTSNPTRLFILFRVTFASSRSSCRRQNWKIREFDSSQGNYCLCLPCSIFKQDAWGGTRPAIQPFIPRREKLSDPCSFNLPRQFIELISDSLANNPFRAFLVHRQLGPRFFRPFVTSFRPFNHIQPRFSAFQI